MTKSDITSRLAIYLGTFTQILPFTITLNFIEEIIRIKIEDFLLQKLLFLRRYSRNHML